MTKTIPGAPKPFQPYQRDRRGHHATGQMGGTQGRQCRRMGVQRDGSLPRAILEDSRSVESSLHFFSLCLFPSWSLLPRHSALALTPFLQCFLRPGKDTPWLKAIPLGLPGLSEEGPQHKHIPKIGSWASMWVGAHRPGCRNIWTV